MSTARLVAAYVVVIAATNLFAYAVTLAIVGPQ